MKTKYFFFSILIFTALYACNEDFLDRYPLDMLTDVSMTFSEREMELYCNNFYPSLPGVKAYEWSQGIFWGDNHSDNMVPSSYTSIPQVSGTFALSRAYGWSWETIRDLNYFLENCHKTEEPSSIALPYIAEIRYFRAYHYFNLLTMFGDLPWYNKTLTMNSPELYDPRISRSVICDSILADLDFAVKHLKPKKQAVSLRLNRESALTLKSRVALFEGTWEKYHKGTAFAGSKDDEGIKNYLLQARDAAYRIIQEGNFNIYSTNNKEWDYINLFNQRDLSDNPEIILWKKFDADQQVGHSGMRYRAGGTGISKSLVDAYLDQDGIPIAKSLKYQGDRTLEDVVKFRDRRLRHMILLPGEAVEYDDKGNNAYPFYFNWMPSGDAAKNTTGYQLLKGQIREVKEGQLIGTGTRAEIIFRYAEVLLNYVEARAELGELTAEDITLTIDKIRTRVGMPKFKMENITVDPKWDFPELSPLMNEIRRERRIELACEGFRYYDLFRWRAHHLLKSYKPKGVWAAMLPQAGGINPYTGAANPQIRIGQNVYVGSDGYVQPYLYSLPDGFRFNENRDYLLPIPVSELTLNPNLKQNPGWERE